MHTTTQSEPARRASAREQSVGGSTIVSLVSRESMTLTVVCDPEPEYVCSRADVRAATLDDRDTRDN